MKWLRPTKRMRRLGGVLMSLASLTGPRFAFADLPLADPRGSKATSLYLHGKDYLSRGDAKRAVASFSEAIRLVPDVPEFYEGRAAGYENLRQPDKARQDFINARQLRSGTAIVAANIVGTDATNGAVRLVQDTAPPAPSGDVPPPRTPNDVPPPRSPNDVPPPRAPQDIPPPPSAAGLSTPSAGGAGSSIADILTSRLASAGSQASAPPSGAPQSTISASSAASAAASSTGQLLEQTPSVNVRRTSALNLDPRIRGFSSTQLNATANGVNMVKARIDIDPLFSPIDPGIVENITVIDGPYNVLYGPGFGFLIAELKQTPRYKCAEAHYGMDLGYNTNGRQFYNRENVWGGGEDYGFYASYGLRTGNDYMPGGSSTDFRVPASFQQWDGYFATGLDLTSTLRTEINYIRVEKNDVELPGVIYDIRNSKEEIVSMKLISQEDREGPEQASLHYWYTRTPYYGDSRNFAKHQTFYDRYVSESYRGFNGAFGPGNLANTFGQGTTLTTGVRSLLTWGEKDETLLTVGADWRRTVQSYREQHVDISGLPNTSIFGDQVFGIPESSMEDFGILGNLVVPATETVKTTIGSRLDFNRAFVSLDQVNQGGTRQQPAQGSGLGTPNELLTMVFTTTKWQATKENSVDVGVGYAMRMPTLAELYSDDPFVPLVRFGNATVTGNSELTPERNLQFDVGTTRQTDFYTVGARAYYSDIENYILYTRGPNGGNPNGQFSSPTYNYANIDRASLYGGSLFGEVKVLDGVALNSTANYTRGTNHDPQQLNNDGTPALDGAGNLVKKGAEGLPNIFPFVTTLGLRFFNSAEDKWSFEFLGRFVNGQNFVADSLNEVPTPGYSVFDLRGYYRVNDSFRLTSSIENLFDRSYTQHGSLAVVDTLGQRSFVKEPGTTLRLGAELRY